MAQSREEKRAYDAAHYAAHREEILAKLTAYNHSPEGRAARARYKLTEKGKEADRRHYKAHREEILARHAAYRQTLAGVLANERGQLNYMMRQHGEQLNGLR